VSSDVCAVKQLGDVESVQQPVHLLAADEAVKEGHRYGTYLALCGQPVSASTLPRASCPDGCECPGVVYCFFCLRAATERNWDAGVDVDCPPGIVVRTSR
jgi:hypothetical protein